jgi:hypothetical protein
LNHGVVLEVVLLNGVVLEDFHKADPITVVQVVEELEGAHFLSIRLVVVTELLDTFIHHVLAKGCSAVESSVGVLSLIKQELGDGAILDILVI